MIKNMLENHEFIQKIGVPRLLIMILAGVILIIASVHEDGKSSGILSGGKKASEPRSESSSEDIALDAMQRYVKSEEEQLENILQKVDGIGEVKVMITLASSEEKLTLQNKDTSDEVRGEDGEQESSNRDRSTSYKSESVILSSDGKETPYVVQINSPKIEGVAVVAKGAGSGEKDAQIIQMIQALFEIEAHKIKVVKME